MAPRSRGGRARGSPPKEETWKKKEDNEDKWQKKEGHNDQWQKKEAETGGNKHKTSPTSHTAPDAEPEKTITPEMREEAQTKWNEEEKEETQRAQYRNAASEKLVMKKLEKSMAKMEKFQNRLKRFAAAELAALLKELKTLDCSKFISEVTEALLESAGSTLKLKEVLSCVELCVGFHQIYEEFSPSFAAALQKAFNSDQLNRKRVVVRLTSELVLVGVIPAEHLIKMAGVLLDATVDKEVLCMNLTVLSSLLSKHGFAMLGILGLKKQEYEQILGKQWANMKQCVLEKPVQDQLKAQCIQCYQACGPGLLQHALSQMTDQEQINQKIKIDKGTVDVENETKYGKYREQYNKVVAFLQTLSDALQQPFPTLEGPTRIDAKTEKKDGAQDDAGQAAAPAIFDEEEKRFYEDIIDLKDVVPAMLLGEKANFAGFEDKDAAILADDFELYLARVQQAETARVVDLLIVEFCHEFNTKANRRKLANLLLNVRRTSLHLIPAHSRIIATVAPYLKDIPQTVLQGLQTEFEDLTAEKSPTMLEEKIRNIRYLSTLCKFSVAPPGIVLDALRIFCDDFSLHNSELAAHIMTTCGRFLLYTPTTASRMENLMERVMRLKNVKSLPLRNQVMLEDAYYQLRPPEAKMAQQKARSPMEDFTRHLMFDLIYKKDEDEVLQLSRKLPWGDGAETWMRKAILDLNFHSNYENMHCLASLLSGLSKYQEGFVYDVVDGLLEQIQVALERNDFRECPSRVRQIKLLGELYAYRIVDSQVIFDTLYHLIGFGSSTSFRCGHIATALRLTNFVDPMHPLEPAWDFFRIKLVCVLLDCVGHYFDRGAAKHKLKRFLVFFERFVYSKGELPLRVQFVINDTLDALKEEFLGTSDAVDKAIGEFLTAEKDRKPDNRGDEEEAPRRGSKKTCGQREEAVDEDDDDDSDDEDDSDDDSEDDDSSSSSGSDDSSSSSSDYDRGDSFRKEAAEDESDFDRALQGMLIESIEQGKQQRKALAELPIPKTSDAPDIPSGFQFLTKNKGKILTKAIAIPQESKLTQASQKTGGEEEERLQMKRFIMRAAEEERSKGTGKGSKPVTIFPSSISVRRVKTNKGGGRGGGKGTPAFQQQHGAL